jgi:hypothetical protein
MLAPGSGSVIIEGSLPNCDQLVRQKLYVCGNGLSLGEFDVPAGDFLLKVPVSCGNGGEPVRLKIEASRWLVPARFHLRGDRRRLAYRLKSIRWEQTSHEALPIAVSASLGA